MNRHASMNRSYRLIWSAVREVWIPVAEKARGRGRRASNTLVAATLALGAACAQGAGPTGGQVTAGSGRITQSGTTTTITQSSAKLALSWTGFNIPAADTVDFVQPSDSAIAVNRILDVNATQILGHLDANGQVYLINPNGIVFGPGAELNVGGLVASTLALGESGAGANTQTFSGSSVAGVSNQGTITASAGGSVALIGDHVGNTGVISAQLGTVALAAGSAVTLRFSGTHLLSLQVDRSVLASVAANGGLIRADGGHVLMTAGAQKALLASVVNNTGVIEARTLEHHHGSITLLGGMTNGTVNVGGMLDASAPTGGDGGAIDTSAAHVQIANAARVTSAAAHGLAGTWLIDPTDFTIAASGADETGAQLSGALASGNVAIASSAGASGTAGNINVNDSVSWSAHTLTLTAYNDININSAMVGSGTAALALEYGQGAVAAGNLSTYNVNAPVTLPAGGNFTTRLGSNGSVTAFTVITSLGQSTDATTAPATATLQGIAATANRGGNFALGADIDASATASWNPCTTCNGGAAGHYGFAPIGTQSNPYVGNFDGLGHSISNLTIHTPGSTTIGLFGQVATNIAPAGSISNLGLLGASVAGSTFTGVLVGANSGKINNSYATGSVTGAAYTGGLVGANYGGAISTSYAAVTVNGAGPSVGGLVGGNQGSINASHASGNVTNGAIGTGGLVGASMSVISNSYATGNVTTGTLGGGLVGYNVGPISNSYATGNVTGDSQTGGLTGINGGAISASHATGNVTGITMIGGLSGSTYGSITGSFATGNVTATGPSIGGLVGMITAAAGAVSNSHATGSVTGANYTGGLVGNNVAAAPITSSYALGSVTGGRYTGGLVGSNYGAVSTSYAAGAVTGTLNVGGLLGINGSSGTVNNSYATGEVTGGVEVGGLLGANFGALTNGYATGSVSGSNYSGGLIGGNFGTVTNSFYSSAANPNLTGIGEDGGNTPDVPGSVMGMTLAQFQAPANFTSATVANGALNPTWDLTTSVAGSSVWFMYAGETAPLLRVFMTPLTITGSTVQTYDGIAFVPDLASLTYSITPPDATHLLGSLTVSGAAQGALHAGSYSYTPGGLYSDQLGYLISYATGTLRINPATLTVTGTRVSTKVYNGTTVAALTGGSLLGVIGSDTVTLTQAGSFASRNAGSGIAVTAADGLGGAAASDYVLVEPTGITGSISPAPLTVTGTTVGSKVYDGTSVAALSGGALVGVIAGDTVTLTQAGSFASRNPGAGIAVTAADTLGGASALDYSLIEPTGLRGTITPAGSANTPGTPGASGSYGGATSPLLAAYYASAQLDSNLVAPQWGAEPQVIDASSSIAVVQTAMEPASTDAGVDQNSSSTSDQGVIINVAMKIGAVGTLTILNGGVRLPW